MGETERSFEWSNPQGTPREIQFFTLKGDNLSELAVKINFSIIVTLSRSLTTTLEVIKER